jgi:DNA primase
LIPQEKVQEIVEAARIEEVVGEFVSLKKRGANLLGVCPFHNEKTPSFTVSPAKGIYKCFGCCASGNAVKFVMEHEHYSYPEALRWVAQKYGIEVEEVKRSPEEIKAMDERESMYNLSAFAQKYFSDQLHFNDEGKAVAHSYLIQRGISDAAIKKFQIGYCLNKSDEFTKHATNHGYKKEYLLSTGLSSDRNERLYDKFRGRVLFPIHNVSGRVIGFGGRILTNDKNRPKYLNSPESAIYHKSKVLYGIYFAKNEISKKDNCYLVEGYTDVISLHLAGVENVVASSGTSLTTDQIKLISRYTQNVTILYDGDNAGIKASFRGIDMILEQGMNVKVVLFPEGEDPDSFARSNPSSKTQQYIQDSAQDFIHFKISVLRDEAGNDPVKRAGLIRQILQSIALIPDLIARQVYVKQCADLLDFNEETLITELNKLLDKNLEKVEKEKAFERAKESRQQPAVQQPKVVKMKTSSIFLHEQVALRVLIEYGQYLVKSKVVDEYGHEDTKEVSYAEYLTEEVEKHNIGFSTDLNRIIYELYVEQLKKDIIPDQAFFINHPNGEISSAVIDLTAQQHELLSGWAKKKIDVTGEDANLKKMADRFLLSFRAFIKKEQIDELTTKLQNNDDFIEILRKIRDLKDEYQTINEQLGRVYV